MTAKKPFLSAALVVAAATCAANVSAEPSPDAREAQRLFEEARVLAENGRWVEACPRLYESQHLEPNITTQFRLADCYERVGRTASAWANYVEVAKAAAAAGETAKERYASERAAKLEPNVDKILLVTPADSDPELEIERDGRTIPRAAWKTPQPLDPGEHTIHAWSPGKNSFDLLITVTGKGEQRRIEIPQLEPAPPWHLGTDATAPKPRPVDLTPSLQTSEKRRSSTAWRPVGWIVGGVGVAAVGIGGGMFIAESTRSDPCAGARCVPAATVIGVGAAAVVVGALLLVATGND